MLLGDREFIGKTWLNYLIKRDIPFTVRLRDKMYATLEDGRKTWLSTLLTTPRKGRRAVATLNGLKAPLYLAAKTPRRGEAVIVATNRQGHDALQTYRKRWSIDLRRENDPPDRFLILLLFANCKTRGLNFEDTKLTDPAKLHLLTALVAIAWANQAAKTTLGNANPKKKNHGYFEKSVFRTGFDFIKNRFKADPENVLHEWKSLEPVPKIE